MSQEYPSHCAPDVLTSTPHGPPWVPSALMSLADALRNATVWAEFMWPYLLRWHSRTPSGVFGDVQEPPGPGGGVGGFTTGVLNVDVFDQGPPAVTRQ